MEWTNEQQQVIDTRNSSLIVSAAAGSGKTAVLVERICSLIVNDGADLEHMLVATFTRAAAAEMKGRIVQRLALAAAQGGPDSKRLNEQLLIIERAPIGTLHSFCGDLLRQYYNIAGIEPSFKTEDESITQGIYEEALAETVDAFFEQGDRDFMLLADCWGGREGNGLMELVRKVYNAARNYPDYMQWLEHKTEMFSFADGASTPWHDELRSTLASCIQLAMESVDEAIKTAGQQGGPESYLPRLTEDRIALMQLLDFHSADDMDGLSGALNSSGLFGRLPSWKDTSGTGLGERAKELRDEAKKYIRKARENPIICGYEDAVLHTREMYPQMKALHALVAAFDSRYSADKRYANVLDFSDLEHMALAVLDDEDAREEIQASFDTVFVDEYQDISPIQDELLRRVSRMGAFFCVGDVKQSIYRFRSAEPEIFIHRLDNSSVAQGAMERRIDLNRNFRSAGRVITLANYLFTHLMSRHLGGVEYKGNEMLVQAAHEPDVALKDCKNELILIDNGAKKEEELSRLEELIQIEREATVAAQRIQELAGTLIWDGKSGTFKKLRYSDIAVLMRTVSHTASEYAEVFRRAGIPVYAEAEGGFAGELEVQLLMNLLMLIDNMYRDFELITSMHSQFGKFSLEDLIEIRGLCPVGSFAEAVQKAAGETDSDLAERIKAFLACLDRWRELARYSDIEKLLYHICDETGFYDYAGTLPEGERRQANIAHLASLARGFAGGLYDFICDFDRLAAAGTRGRVQGQAAGAVTIMSVHKSKGLEFPVVILTNTGKQMNLQDAGESMLIHGRLGLGPRYFNADKRTKAETLARAAISERIRQETLSEEMRMLYVAVTRAREQLIIVGTVADLGQKLSKWSLPQTPAGLSARARCWADWLGAMALRTEQGREVLGNYGAVAEALEDGPHEWKIAVIDAASIRSAKPVAVDRAAALEKLITAAGDTAVPEELAAALEWKYPWGDVAALPSKVSATSLLDKERNWRGPIPAPEIRRLPQFMEEKKRFSATDLGTFVHTALQLLPADIEIDDIPVQVSALEQRGLLPEGAVSAINIGWIERFFRSGIAGRMRASGRVQRELPFNLAVPVSEVYPNETSGEEILVQGIIDCCFIEDGRWVLLDYKTNRVDAKQTAEKIAEYYRPQLKMYSNALEAITGIEVKEAWLYLLSVGAEAKVAIK